jgi:predicted O-methyltransferase YrrM
VSQTDFEAALSANQPYFGPHLGCRRSWPHIYWFQQKLLKKLGGDRADRSAAAPLSILEIGAWAGASTVSWGEGLLRYFAGRGHIVSVDAWASHTEPVADLAPTAGAIKHVFLHNVRASGLAAMVEPVQAESDAAFDQLAGRRFDVIYVDGDHRYEQVRRDLANAKKYLTPGGVICGDDLEVQMGDGADDIVAETVARNEAWAAHPESGLGFHPGVTQAVFESFGRVSAWGGFWAMAETEGGWEPISLDGIDAEVPRCLGQYDEDGRRLFDL